MSYSHPQRYHVQLDHALISRALGISDDSQARAKSLVAAYESAVNSYNNGHPQHPRYQRESELELRSFVVMRASACLVRRSAELQKVSEKLNKRIDELFSKVKTDLRREVRRAGASALSDKRLK